MKSLPGWNLSINEISAGCYVVKLADNFGHLVELMDSDANDDLIAKAKSDAFNIQMQLSGKTYFLYLLALELLDGSLFTEQKYQREIFGSWHFTIKDKQLAYDGRDWSFWYREKINGEWDDLIYIPENKLDYYNFVETVKKIASL